MATREEARRATIEFIQRDLCKPEWNRGIEIGLDPQGEGSVVRVNVTTLEAVDVTLPTEVNGVPVVIVPIG